MRTRQVLQSILRLDLVAFIGMAFRTVYPTVPYVPTWHIEAIAHQLVEVRRGIVLRLIINQPPRSLKSLSASVAFVAWLLSHNPGLKIVVVGYSNELAEELHRHFRLVVTSPWYRALFPNVRIVRDTATELITSENGGRLALSVGGSFTGRGADIAIIDDPQKEEDGFSDAARKKAIEWVTGTLFNRLNNKARSPVIVVQQRLHEDDLSGFLLSQGGWRHLKLSAIATARKAIALGKDHLGRNRLHIRQEGEPLQPKREGLAALAQIKTNKGGLLFSAHYQQEPVPLEGNLLKRDRFRLVDAPPSAPSRQVVQSWDIASQTGDANDYSVCLTISVVKGDYYLIDVWRGRLQYPDLRRMIIAQPERHRAAAIIIEDAGPGLQLLQDLNSDPPLGMIRPIGRKPEGNKVDRMAIQAAKIEAGHFHLVKAAPWLPDFLNEVLAFPRGRHDDQVDALSQFLAWAQLGRRLWMEGQDEGMPRIVYG